MTDQVTNPNDIKVVQPEPSLASELWLAFAGGFLGSWFMTGFLLYFG